MKGTQTLQLSRADIAAFPLEHVAPLTAWHANSKYFLSEPGQEHYRLLGHLAAQLPSPAQVADVGTYLGFSALALSAKDTVRVTSYDIADCVGDAAGNTPELSVRDRANVRLELKSCFDAMDQITACPLIVLDVDPHDGVQERRFMEHLTAVGYRGMVVCDDINLNAPMRAFWDDVKQPKRDVTDIGHWSGTGIVLFGDAFAFP